MGDVETLEKETVNSSVGIKGTNPKLDAKVVKLMDMLRAKGWDPVIAAGMRTAAQHAQDLKKGTSHIKRSKHQDGLAFDVVQRHVGWTGAGARLDYQFWYDLGEAAHAVGLKWGGDWDIKGGFKRYTDAMIKYKKTGKVDYFIDVAHIQLR